MLVETKGATACDDDVTYPPGTRGFIDDLADFGEYQGTGVHLIIGEGDRIICNSFDNRDVEKLGQMPFRPSD
jgi:hypothetical protein